MGRLNSDDRGTSGGIAPGKNGASQVKKKPEGHSQGQRASQKRTVRRNPGLLQLRIAIGMNAWQDFCVSAAAAAAAVLFRILAPMRSLLCPLDLHSEFKVASFILLLSIPVASCTAHFGRAGVCAWRNSATIPVLFSLVFSLSTSLSLVCFPF